MNHPTIAYLLAASAAALLPGAGALAQATKAPAAVAAGSYECWANGAARLLMNFKIVDGKRYASTEGERGAYNYDPANGQIGFKGGHLDGAMPKGFTAVYREPKGRPTVSFRSARGSEAAFCEKVGK